LSLPGADVVLVCRSCRPLGETSASCD
jgi:hypothetical protein